MIKFYVNGEQMRGERKKTNRKTELDWFWTIMVQNLFVWASSIHARISLGEYLVQTAYKHTEKFNSARNSS
jgi:hypothetical protein